MIVCIGSRDGVFFGVCWWVCVCVCGGGGGGGVVGGGGGGGGGVCVCVCVCVCVFVCARVRARACCPRARMLARVRVRSAAPKVSISTRRAEYMALSRCCANRKRCSPEMFQDFNEGGAKRQRLLERWAYAFSPG